MMQRNALSPSLGSSLLYDGDPTQATPVSPAGLPSISASVTSWSLSPGAPPLMTPWQLALADTLEREEQDAKAHQRAAAASPSAFNFYNPTAWRKAFKSMTRAALYQNNQVSLFHDAKAGLNLEHELRLGCCVRILPRLSVIKAALQKLTRRNDRRKVSSYDMWESTTTAGSVSPWRSPPSRSASQRATGAASRDADRVVPSYQPTPSLWAVREGSDQEILVFDAFTGRQLMRILDPKLNVPPTAILHAPFRGFMNRQLHVVPVNKPQDILRLKEAQLINTDYVWVGFADGSIRLFPADHERIRDTDRASQLSKGEMADIVFELPKHHAASIISIVRSPCHHDDEGADYSTRNRLSSAVYYMTAAGTSSANSAGATAAEGKKTAKGNTREHLSLICTASVDSVVVVWDIRKIYQALEAIRTMHREEAASGGAGLTSTRSAVSVMTNEVVTIEGAHPLFTIRSSCTMVKVRPLMRLKGGVAGFKSLQWVSTLVTSAGFEQPRNVAELTRDVEEASAPQLLRQRRARQNLTRFQRREEHRKLLQLPEDDMRDLEKLLDEMMPSLKDEPVQSMRVNFLVAGDSVGTVHMWNLDEELQKSMSDTIATARSIRSGANTPHASPSRMESPGRQSNISAAQYSTASPSVQLSAMESVRTKDRVRTAAGKLKSLRQAHKQKKGTTATASSAASTNMTGSATPLAQKVRGIGGSVAGGSTVKKTPRSAQKSSAGGAVAGASSHKKKKSATPGKGSAVKQKAKDSEGGSAVRPTSRLTSLSNAGPTATQRPATSLTHSTTLTASSAAGTHKGQRRAMPLLSKPSKGASEVPSHTARGSVSTARTSLSPSRPRASIVLSESSLERHASVSQSTTRHSISRKSPTRHESGATESQGSPLRRTTPSKSMDRTARSRANEYLSRASQCRIEFTGGVAITGMAVDLPPVLVRTLRRLPETQSEHVSLLEQPSQEQVLRRTLENEFEPLTEEKAVYFAFQQLQMYVSVEGAVLNLRCEPHWKDNDADGRELFKIHHTAESDLQRLPPLYRPALQHDEVKVSGEVGFAGFGVEFHKTMLEGHSQPVTALFLDVARRLVWVARNGGLMSLFSTDTKKIVTRVPHPNADAALGPPNRAEWRAQQADYVRNRDEPLHLERHKETLKYKPAFFRDVIPFSTRTQVSLLLVSAASRRDVVGDGDGAIAWRDSDDGAQNLFSSYHSFLSNMRDRTAGTFGVGPMLEVQRVEGRSDMAVPARRREKRLKEVLDHLRLCRVSAVLVRKAEKEEYEQYGDLISSNVAYIVREIGAYTALPVLRRAFHHWQSHATHFKHEHVMRHQRTARLERARFLALGLERNCRRQITAQYFVKWLRWRALRQAELQDACLHRLLEQLSGVRTHPTPAMMQRLSQFRTQQNCWRAWQTFVVRRRRSTLAAWLSSGAGVQESLHQSPYKLAGLLGETTNVTDGRAGSPLRRTATAKYRTSSIVGTHMSGGAYRGGPPGHHHHRTATGPGIGPLHYDDEEDDMDGDEDDAPHDMDVHEMTQSAPLNEPDAATDNDAVLPPSIPDGDAETEPLLERFRHITYVILHSRSSIMRFEESEATPESVVDESWMSIVESAEAGADDESDADSRRLSVFRYGLLALLQGLLSTADDVLPNIDNDSIADEVVSMLLGIQLCMDYIAADPDGTLAKVGDRFVAATLYKSIAAEDSPRRSRSVLKSTAPFLSRTATQAPQSLGREHTPGYGSDSSSRRALSPSSAAGTNAAVGRGTQRGVVNPLLLSHEDACLCVLEVYARKALEDAECREAMQEIVNDSESLDAFVSFVSEERPERRRSVS